MLYTVFIYLYIYFFFFPIRYSIRSHLCFIDVLHIKLSERLRHSVKLRRFVVYMFVAHAEIYENETAYEFF